MRHADSVADETPTEFRIQSHVESSRLNVRF